VKTLALRLPRAVRFLVVAALLTVASYGVYRLRADSFCEQTGLETVQSDKAHYALGDTALITGSGFAPSCNVVVRVTRPDLSVVKGDGQNTPGSDEVVTDASGNFTYAYVVADVAGRWYNFDILGQGGGLSGDLFSAGPIVWTDKGDYKPGETITISGRGWQPGEAVSLRLHENPSIHTELVLSATADASGSFVNTDFSAELHDLGVNFTLTATGSSGSSALNYFNDAAAFVQSIGNNTKSQVGNSSITVTVPGAGVAATDSIIVTLQAGSFAGAMGCSDTINGATYNTDISSAAGTGRIAIVSKHASLALPGGTVITCTYPAFSGASSVSAYEFSGLTAVGALDGTNQGGSSNAGSITSGLTPTTSQADALVFGFIQLGVVAQTFTPATSGGSPAEVPYNPPYTTLLAAGTQKPMYRIVNNGPRQYEANGTVSGSGGWKAQVAVYKAAAVPTPTPTDTPTSTPTSTPTETPTSTPTSTPTDTPTSTPTDTPTSTPTDTPTTTPTNTPTATDTPTNTPTVTPSNTPSRTPTRTPSNTPTRTPTNTPTPTRTPTNTPTRTPTPAVTSTPTRTPTRTPTPTPTSTLRGTVTAFSGTASNVGVAAGGSAIDIAENFTFNGTMNLSTATVTISSLLQEVGGAGELVQGVPITLAFGGTDPDEGPFYSSPSGVDPKYRFVIKIQDPQQGKWTSHLKVDNAVLPKYPTLCTFISSNTYRTNLTTVYSIKPSGGGASLVVSTVQPWRCLDFVGGDPNKPSSLRAP
jgi:hypothetical protein